MFRHSKKILMQNSNKIVANKTSYLLQDGATGTTAVVKTTISSEIAEGTGF
jgi:hypothetical protein